MPWRVAWGTETDGSTPSSLQPGNIARGLTFPNQGHGSKWLTHSRLLGPAHLRPGPSLVTAWPLCLHLEVVRMPSDRPMLPLLFSNKTQENGRGTRRLQGASL